MRPEIGKPLKSYEIHFMAFHAIKSLSFLQCTKFDYLVLFSDFQLYNIWNNLMFPRKALPLPPLFFQKYGRMSSPIWKLYPARPYPNPVDGTKLT